MKLYFRSNKMKEARIKKKITQEDLAELCNSSDRYIRDLELGKKSHPSANILYLLSLHLEIPMDELIEVREEFP